jgi:uncharacterized protein YbaR (Trm112 family)
MAAPANELLDLLADPETHEPLSLASEAELSALRAAVSAGKAKRRDGKPVNSEFEGALLTSQRRAAYLIEAGIPNLLLDERLELSEPVGAS